MSEKKATIHLRHHECQILAAALDHWTKATSNDEGYYVPAVLAAAIAQAVKQTQPDDTPTSKGSAA